MNSLVGLLRLADDVLRGETSPAGRTRELQPHLLGSLTLAVVVYGMFYGGVMGSYGGIAGSRIWQVVYSAVKVPFLLFATFLLSLPSFFVTNTLLGLRSDFPRVIRALMSTQAGLTVILSALAPFTAFWYVSGSGYQPAILFNGVMFGVASFSAQWMLRRSYRRWSAPIPGIAGCSGPGSSSTCSSVSRWAGCSGRSSATPGSGPVLPGGKLEQRLRGRHPDDLGRAERAWASLRKTSFLAIVRSR